MCVLLTKIYIIAFIFKLFFSVYPSVTNLNPSLAIDSFVGGGEPPPPPSFLPSSPPSTSTTTTVVVVNKNPETSATAGSEEEDDSDSYDDLDDFDVPQDMDCLLYTSPSPRD